MNLVIVSKHSLEDLEKLAVENFSEVVNKNAELQDFSKEIIYDESSLGHIFKVVPEENLKRLELRWAFPTFKN
jgi:secreted Zn-dependent insulinase-like peptidase